MSSFKTATTKQQKQVLDYLRLREKLERPWKQFVNNTNSEEQGAPIHVDISQDFDNIKLDGSKAMMSPKSKSGA